MGRSVTDNSFPEQFLVSIVKPKRFVVKYMMWLLARTNFPHYCPNLPNTVYTVQTRDCQQKKQIQLILCFISQKFIRDSQTTILTNLADKFLVRVFTKILTVTATLLVISGQHASKMQAFSIWMPDPGPAHMYAHTYTYAHNRSYKETSQPKLQHVHTYAALGGYHIVIG